MRLIRSEWFLYILLALLMVFWLGAIVNQQIEYYTYQHGSQSGKEGVAPDKFGSAADWFMVVLTILITYATVALTNVTVQQKDLLAKANETAADTAAFLLAAERGWITVPGIGPTTYEPATNRFGIPHWFKNIGKTPLNVSRRRYRVRVLKPADTNIPSIVGPWDAIDDGFTLAAGWEYGFGKPTSLEPLWLTSERAAYEADVLGGDHTLYFQVEVTYTVVHEKEYVHLTTARRQVGGQFTPVPGRAYNYDGPIEKYVMGA